MVMTKAVIWGPHDVEAPATGKTELGKALAATDSSGFNEHYDSTVGASFYTRFLNLGYETLDKQDSVLQIWDVAGNRRFNSLYPAYARGRQVLLYCVDLTQTIDVDQLEATVDQYKKLNPNGQVVLVGTKADHENASTESFEQIDEKKLGIEFKIATSAKDRTGLDKLLEFITDLAKSLNNPLQTSPKKERERESSPSRAEQTSIQVFPDSYKDMWDAASVKANQKNLDPSRKKYEAALALLKDYCKTESYNESSLYSSVKRFFTSHMLRNHVTTVRDIVTTFDNPDFKGKKTVENLLAQLEKALEHKLVETKKTINPIGSLARRINFIQQEAFGKDTNNHIINIGELNIKIEQGPKTPTNPSSTI